MLGGIIIFFISVALLVAVVSHQVINSWSLATDWWLIPINKPDLRWALYYLGSGLHLRYFAFAFTRVVFIVYRLYVSIPFLAGVEWVIEWILIMLLGLVHVNSPRWLLLRQFHLHLSSILIGLYVSAYQFSVVMLTVGVIRSSNLFVVTLRLAVLKWKVSLSPIVHNKHVLRVVLGIDYCGCNFLVIGLFQSKRCLYLLGGVWILLWYNALLLYLKAIGVEFIISLEIWFKLFYQILLSKCKLLHRVLVLLSIFLISVILIWVK